MKSSKIAAFCALAVCAPALCASPAAAWGTKGHTIINTLAAKGFAGRMPAFLTTPAAQFELSYLGPQPDRLKGSGGAWDSDYDPGHYIDLLDDETVSGAVSLKSLPSSRAGYDTALRAAQTDQYKQGFLPYAILDGWEQLRTDFAYWQADSFASKNAATPAVRAQERSIAAIDEQMILADLGMWGHYVGDASQPLHTSVHFNGWGAFPNPKGYTDSHRTHSFFESTFVGKYVTQDLVAAAVKPASSIPAPQTLLTQEQVLGYIAAYLHDTLSNVPQLYDIEKAGGFESGTAQARAFAATRLAAGAMELRDLSVLAWQDSAHDRIGYPSVSLQDVLTKKMPWPQSQGD